MIAQADQVDLTPAFLWLAFDARDNRQTARKENAFNFGDGAGFAISALEVLLGGFPFTALGHETRTGWVLIDGIPAVEAEWWAGGLLVTENLFALQDLGVFVRRISLSSRNLGGPEEVKLRLSLPAGACLIRDGWLVQENTRARIALACADSVPSQFHPEQADIEIGPLAIPIGGSVTVDTFLSAGILPDDRLPERPFNLDRTLARTRATWSTGSSLVTEDATVREVFDKARFGLPAMVADNGVMDAGIFEYGAQRVRDTSNTLLGLVHAGYFELARSGFVHILETMVSADGNAMIGSVFADPDREQFDQMGELIGALKAYRDWSGDDTLIHEYRSKLLALIERPLRPEFRHASGMVHNRREFWERTLDDGCELAYQTYVIVGLRDAAALAAPLGATDRAARWRSEADSIQNAMLSHSSFALVEQDRLIKRRSVDGRWERFIRFPAAAPDVPMKTEQVHLAEPDSTMALPIALGIVDPRSTLARNTLDELERLWNARWFGGGYERYHSSGQVDQPGPWTFATCFILRAQHDAGLLDRSRRTLEWLNTVQGGRTGAWFEEIPLVRSQAATAGILPWTSGEISLFVIRHVLGIRFEDGEVVVRPRLYPGSPPARADLRFRAGRLLLEVPGAGPFRYAVVNGQRKEVEEDGAVRLAADFEEGSVSFHT
ncbi:MAG: hypothetical protein P4K98_01505 [Bryobacteraceae bacterium]|nr:hypothetical protein [Bryobacteraceae bacterium]